MSPWHSGNSAQGMLDDTKWEESAFLSVRTEGGKKKNHHFPVCQVNIVNKMSLVPISFSFQNYTSLCIHTQAWITWVWHWLSRRIDKISKCEAVVLRTPSLHQVEWCTWHAQVVTWYQQDKVHLSQATKGSWSFPAWYPSNTLQAAMQPLYLPWGHAIPASCNEVPVRKSKMAPRCLFASYLVFG